MNGFFFRDGAAVSHWILVLSEVNHRGPESEQAIQMGSAGLMIDLSINGPGWDSLYLKA